MVLEQRTKFNKLGFSYDLYGKTSRQYHKEFVRQFHEKLYNGEYVYEKIVKQAICPSCNKVLSDRLIVGRCPVCGEKTKGDQCDSCGEIIDIDTIIEPKCMNCSSSLLLEDSTGLFISLSKLKNELVDFLKSRPRWRKNAIAFTKRYIDEGLRDRAITRDIDWGIDVPKKGYDNKKIYIWAENVLGYLSASKEVCERIGIPFKEVWGENARHYYVHGKDNIPFHTIILPALLLGHGGQFRLPDDIISSEFMTLEGKRISTSENFAIWAKDIVHSYNPDSLRYFFIANGPEKRDTDFFFREFIEQNNNELLGAYGNFVNRTLVFIKKYLNGIVPEGTIEDDIGNKINDIFPVVGEKIENGQFRDAIEIIFDFIRFGNKYFDLNQPWKTRSKDEEKCNDTLFNCVQIIANLSILLYPFLPFSSEKIFTWLGLNSKWEVQNVPSGYVLPEISILFERLLQ